MRSKLIKLMLAIAVVVMATSCSDLSDTTSVDQSTSRKQPAVTGSPSDCKGPSTENKPEAGKNVSRGPIRIAILQDKSGSANNTRTSQLSEDDFDELITLLRCTGGELAVGIVDDVSNRTLVRLRIEIPPDAPPLSQASNVFERAEEDGLYQQRVKDHGTAVGRWAADTDKRVQSFRAKVGELLKQKPVAKKTNVWSAISRSDLFLNESDATWPGPTRRYAILNSDAVDTTKSKPVEIKSRAQLIVVNGSGSTGVLESLKPERFESIEAAFQFIAAKELGGKEK